jgi:hypothetical protein
MPMNTTPATSECFGSSVSAAFCIAVMLLAVNGAHAQGLQQQVVGAWSPVSQYVEQSGQRLEPFGPNPKGIVIYQADGHFVLYLQKPDLPKFASNNRLAGSADENKAIVQGTITYFGHYSIDENSARMQIHYDGSTFPNWDGEDQVRLVEVSGDQLEITSPVSAVGGGTVHLVLRRMK